MSSSARSDTTHTEVTREQLNEEALLSAIAAVDYGVYVCSPVAPQTTDMAREAVRAYLESMAEQGWRMMPREPTEAMAHRGIDVRQVQDNLNRVHSAIIDTREIWREMFDALSGVTDPEPGAPIAEGQPKP